MTRLAVISDVHADLHALRDALAQIERMGCAAIVLLHLAREVRRPAASSCASAAPATDSTSALAKVIQLVSRQPIKAGKINTNAIQGAPGTPSGAPTAAGGAPGE
jgi:hypothetical protein